MPARKPLCAAGDAGEALSASAQGIRRAVIGKHALATEREALGGSFIPFVVALSQHLQFPATGNP